MANYVREAPSACVAVVGNALLAPCWRGVRRLISNNALEAACFMARELSMPQVQPGHSRRIIATHWREYASEAKMVARLSRRIFPTAVRGEHARNTSPLAKTNN